MKDMHKTKAQLVEELAHLRQRITELEAAEIEQVRMERALREREQYSTLRGIIDSANALIFSVDGQYRYTSFNQGHANVMKALYGAEIEIGHSLLDYMTVPEDRETAKDNLDRALAGEHLVEEAYSGEELRSRRYFQVSHSPIKTETGEIIGVAVLAQDMTEPKRAEEALRENEMRYRAIVEAFDGLIYICSQDYRIEFMNKQLIERTGYDGTGELCFKVLHELDSTCPWCVNDQVFEGKTVRWEVQSPKDNRWYYVVNTPIYHTDGSISKQAMISDITERKTAEMQILASEQLFRALVENSPDFIARYDREFRRVYVNPAIQKLFGRPVEDVLNQTPADQSPVYAPDVYIDQLRQVIETAAECAVEMPFRTAQGETHWGHMRFVPEFGPDGQVATVLAIGRDIHEIKQAEQERLAHLRFFECMDQINRAIQGTTDLEQMMSDVLDVVLSIFECDRAFLLYPCDPEAATWWVPMERNRPEYPGILALGQEMRMDPDVAETFRLLLASDGPVKFGPGTPYPLPKDVSERFGFQCFMSMALHPKVGQPWQLGIHQCAYARIWTAEEERLFQEIGRRLGDGLGTLQAYHQLQDSEERYRLIAENTADTITVFDLNLKPIYVSPSVLKLRGYTVEEAMTQSLDESLTPASLQTVNKLLAEQVILETDETADPARPVLLELEVYCKNGATIWVELAASILKDTHFKPTGLLAVVRDITERKQAEDALRQNREAALRFSEQLAALQQVTIQLSKAESSDDLCRRAVELARSHLGFDRVGIWFIEEDGGFMRGSFGTDEQGKLRDERDLRIEFRHEGLGWQVFSQKQPVAYSEHTTLVHQGQELGEGNHAAGALWDGDQVIGLVYSDNLISHHPITEQQLEILGLYATTLGHLLERTWAEEERERLAIQIREQARELQHILATVPEGVLLLDGEKRIVRDNPVAEKDLAVLAGVKRGDVLTHLGNRSLDELLTSPPTRGLWHEVKADQRIFEVIAKPMDNDLEPEHWVLVINDVTQAREVREQLQQQERMAAVGQLAAGIAHDFNNIMAIIVLYAQMTAQVEALPPHVQERMEIINQQARHATRLIQQILDFSRRSVLERQPLDLFPLLKEQCKLLERTLPENIEVSLDSEPAEYIVNADLTRMQQVLMNLAVNARDAMPEGGKLRFTLSRTAPTDKIRCVACDEVPSGEWVRIVVADTGSGIPSETLPHIFEPFFTTKAPGQGTGLGLPQVYGIVGAHEGHIDVSTKMGKGTTFVIDLPPLLTRRPETAVLETQSVIAGGEETLLVVEDDAVLRTALVDTLRSLNYQVLEAANGQEALDTLQQRAREVALVISDLVMPEMGGQALFYVMRRRNLTLPMIMLSGHPMEQELRSLQAEGLAGWLLKPPDIEQLSRLLAQVLKGNA